MGIKENKPTETPINETSAQNKIKLKASQSNAATTNLKFQKP